MNNNNPINTNLQLLNSELTKESLKEKFPSRSIIGIKAPNDFKVKKLIDKVSKIVAEVSFSS